MVQHKFLIFSHIIPRKSLFIDFSELRHDILVPLVDSNCAAIFIRF